MGERDFRDRSAGCGHAAYNTEQNNSRKAFRKAIGASLVEAAEADYVDVTGSPTPRASAAQGHSKRAGRPAPRRCARRPPILELKRAAACAMKSQRREQHECVAQRPARSRKLRTMKDGGMIAD